MKKETWFHLDIFKFLFPFQSYKFYLFILIFYIFISITIEW